jgi:hypothetical protein
MRRHDSLRASDADRDAVTDLLRQAAGEGRLEPDELEERVDTALRARTYGELAPLIADLPRGPNAPWRRPGRRTRALARSAVLGAEVVAAVAVVAVVVVFLLAAATLAAAWRVACVVFWLVCRASRRRLASGSASRGGTPARTAHRPRPTGLL